MNKAYPFFADLVVLLHVVFVVFAVLGGLLVLRWRRIVWVHLTAVAWAVMVEFSGWICPLTPLENWLRHKSGYAGPRSDFISHYMLPLLYPAGLTRKAQVMLGIFVIGINIAIYGWLWRSNRRSKNVSASACPLTHVYL